MLAPSPATRRSCGNMSQRLASFHARLYGPGSEHVHSQQVALGGLMGIAHVDIDAGDPDLADEALWLAILTYGGLLELAEKSVRHGLVRARPPTRPRPPSDET